MAVLTLFALLFFCLQNASSLDLPDGDLPDDFEATLKGVQECPNSENMMYRWEKPMVERVSRDSVAISADLHITEEIPDEPDYEAEIMIQHQPGDDESKRSPVATVAWPNICGDLKKESNEGVRDFKHSIDMEGGVVCPLKPGYYKMKQMNVSVDDFKPLMRDGTMVFTVTQRLRGQVISCNIIEFEVSWM